MESTSLDFNSFKMQLKARLRVPLLMKSKRLNIEFDKIFKASPSNDITLLSYTQSKIKNNTYMDSFNKFSLKTNIIKNLLSNMNIKAIYEEEKECSQRCKEVINEIDTKKHNIEFINLPPIKTYKKKKIIIKKIQIKPYPSKRLIFGDYMKLDYQRTPYLSSSNKGNSDLESTKEKEKIILKSKSKKVLNSLFRIKNMNDLISFRL